MDHYWGIDLGGTKIEGVVLSSLSSDSPVARLRVDTEAERGYAHILRQVTLLVDQLKQKSGLQPVRIGVGHPGMIDPRTSLVTNSNTQCLNGHPLDRDLEGALGVPIACENDANCFALAEAILGAARGARTVFGVIMGTGVGGGIVIHGQVHRGRHGIAGEWGHNVLVPYGPACYCGKNGCVERILSGPALEAYYAQESGVHLRLDQIASACDRRDPIAVRTIDRLCFWFGRAIAVVVNILDPDTIVLGGGVSNIPALYVRGPHEALRTVFHDQLLTPIVPNQLGDSAGVFGAAMLTR